jgi:4-oxalocrotonate tautomerase
LAGRNGHVDAALLPRGLERFRAKWMPVRVKKTRQKNKSKENDMPLIEVHVIENVFNAEQKRQMISKLTDAMVSIEGENMRGVTWVKISEVASGDWGIGGQPLTTEAVKDLAAGRKVA